MTKSQDIPGLIELPAGCKMRSGHRYASDEDCTACGLGEGDACAAYDQQAEVRLAALRAAAPKSEGAAGGPFVYLREQDARYFLAGGKGSAMVATWGTKDDTALYLVPSNPLPAAREEVGVKPLEWVKDHVNGGWWANTHETGLAGYRVSRAKWCRRGEEGKQFLCATDHEAKNAAQADYETRIRSALRQAPAADEGRLVPKHGSGP